jgi:hypothetical protein
MAVEDQPVEDNGGDITSNQQFRSVRSPYELGLGPKTTAQVKAANEANDARPNLAGKVPPSMVAEMRAETAARTASDDAARRARDPKPAVKKAAATRQANRLKKGLRMDPDTGGLMRDGKPAVYGPNPNLRPPSVSVEGGVVTSDAGEFQPGWNQAALRTLKNTRPGNTRDFTGVMRDVGDVEPRGIALPSQTGDTSGFGEQAGEFELNQRPSDTVGGISDPVDKPEGERTGDVETRTKLRPTSKKKVDTGDDVAQSAGHVARPDVIKEQAAKREEEMKAGKRRPVLPPSGSAPRVPLPGAGPSRPPLPTPNPSSGVIPPVDRTAKPLRRGEAFGPAQPMPGDYILKHKSPTVMQADVFDGSSWNRISNIGDVESGTNALDPRTTQPYPRIVPSADGKARPAFRTSAEYYAATQAEGAATTGPSTDVDFRGERASNTPRPGILPGDPTYPKVNREQAATAASAEELEAARAERETSTRGQRMIEDVTAGIRATGKIEVNRGKVRSLIPVPKGNEATVGELAYIEGTNRAGERVRDASAEVLKASKEINAQRSGQAPTQGAAADVRTILDEALRSQYEGLMRGPVTNTGTMRDPVTGITDIRNVRATRDTRPGTMGDVGRLAASESNRPRVQPSEPREAYPGMDDDGVVIDRDTGQMLRWNEDTEELQRVAFGPSIRDLPAASKARADMTRAQRQRRQSWREQGLINTDDASEAMVRAIDELQGYGRRMDQPGFDEILDRHRAEVAEETRMSQRLGYNPISTGAPGGTDPISTVAGSRRIGNEEAAAIAGRRSGRTARQEQAEALNTSIDEAISEVMRRQSAGEDVDVNAEIARIKRELGGN